MSVTSFYWHGFVRALTEALDWCLGQGLVLSVVIAAAIFIWSGVFAAVRAARKEHSWARALTHTKSALRDFIIGGVLAGAAVMFGAALIFWIVDIPRDEDELRQLIDHEKAVNEALRSQVASGLRTVVRTEQSGPDDAPWTTSVVVQASDASSPASVVVNCLGKVERFDAGLEGAMVTTAERHMAMVGSNTLS
jgi:hypothetical protein